MSKYINYAFLALALAAMSCSNDLEEAVESAPTACGTHVEASLGNIVEGTTRVVTNSNDKWGVEAFGPGDKVGMYALKGLQNPADPELYDLPVVNAEMFFEGRAGSYYRFGNSAYTTDPTTVNGSYSLMYYPYYPDMPPTADKTVQPGLWLRQKDPSDNIEKCVDFLSTSNYSNIQISNGILRPSFRRNFFHLVIIPGEGFEKPDDSRVWVVMKDPKTDIRITQTSATSTFSYTVQYNPVETGDDLMTNIIPESKFTVNKYCVWQAWEANEYNSKPARYAILPPGNVYFILIQDNLGKWQTVADFYLDTAGSKYGYANYKYVVTVKLEGVDVVARPISVQKWDDEEIITDDRKVGISDFQEYNAWVTTYNAYVESERSEVYAEKLKEFGDGVKNTVTGKISWTFYINSDITFPNNEFYRINRLEDVLEGSSTYTNYSVSNIRTSLIGELAPTGAVKALDFTDLYLIQDEKDTNPFGAIAGTLNGGTISKCRIINGVLISNQAAGMVAGTVSGGTVKDCSFSGDVIGRTTEEVYGGLFGVVEKAPTVRNTVSSGVKFIEN